MTYFKFPLDKLAGKIIDPTNPNTTIEFNRSQLGMIEGLEDNRFWVHISARRTGKSFAASILALAKLLEPNQLVTIVAPNYNLSSIIWDYVTGFIHQLELETEKFNAKDRVVQLINKSVFRLLSANNRDSLVGRGANLLIVDEAAVIMEEDYFTRDLRPALSTFADSRALFISTPRGKANYLYEYFLRGTGEKDNEYPDWGSAKFDWTSNPLLSEVDIMEAKSTMPKNQFLQEYYCEWTTFEGQIYAFDEDKHLKDLSDIVPKDSRFDFIAGLDIGYRDATAFIVIATDGEAFYIVDEYIVKEATTSTIAENIKEMEDYWGIDNIYIDSAAQQARADLAYDYDIYCDNGTKSVNDGINYLQVLVEQDKIEVDINNAYGTFKALSSYRWNPRTERQKPVHDDSSHASDAVRYAVYSHFKNTVGIYVAAY